MIPNYAIEIQTYNDEDGEYDSSYICYQNVNLTKVKDEFQRLLIKQSELYLPIKNNPRLRKFFEARIIRTTPNMPTIVDWKESIGRNIYINYRIKINKGKGLSKKLYTLPPYLFTSQIFPNDLKSEQAWDIAREVLSQLSTVGFDHGYGLYLVGIEEKDGEIIS